MSRKATAASNTGSIDAHQTKHTGRDGVSELVEWTADAEPSGRAEQYGEHRAAGSTNRHDGSMDRILPTLVTARTPEPNARGIASRIFFHNGLRSRSSSGWTFASPSWVDPLSLGLTGLRCLRMLFVPYRV